jgi:hypothetical protein
MADAEALDAFGLVEQHVSLLPEVVLPDLLHELVLHVSRAGFAGCQDELLLQLRVLRQVAYGLPDRDYLEQTERVQGQTLMQSAKACRDDCDTLRKITARSSPRDTRRQQSPTHAQFHRGTLYRLAGHWCRR